MVAVIRIEHNPNPDNKHNFIYDKIKFIIRDFNCHNENWGYNQGHAGWLYPQYMLGRH